MRTAAACLPISVIRSLSLSAVANRSCPGFVLTRMANLVASLAAVMAAILRLATGCGKIVLVDAFASALGAII